MLFLREYNKQFVINGIINPFLPGDLHSRTNSLSNTGDTLGIDELKDKLKIKNIIALSRFKLIRDSILLNISDRCSLKGELARGPIALHVIGRRPF